MGRRSVIQRPKILVKTATPFSNSAHVLVPKEWRGKRMLLIDLDDVVNATEENKCVS